MAWTDSQEEGNYVSVHDENIKLNKFTNWKKGEPNGERIENCASLRKDFEWNDLDCMNTKDLQSICIVEEEPSFSLRGLRLNMLLISLFTIFVI